MALLGFGCNGKALVLDFSPSEQQQSSMSTAFSVTVNVTVAFSTVSFALELD